MKNLLMIMDLALTRIIKIFLVDVGQKNALDSLSILSQDGELKGLKGKSQLIGNFI